MRYHTSDTFLVMAAEQKFYEQQVGSCGDVFDDVIVEDVWKPLGLDIGSLSTNRTYDQVNQPFGGFGSTFVRDDIANTTVSISTIACTSYSPVYKNRKRM